MSAIITQLPRRKPRTLRLFRWFWRHPAVTLGGLIVSLIVLAGLFAPLITVMIPTRRISSIPCSPRMPATGSAPTIMAAIFSPA